jgi:arylsulfatase A-like enzyme
MPAVLDGDRDDIPDFAWNLHWKLPEPRLSWLRESGQWKPLVRSYLASTSFVDSQVGRVLTEIENSGHAKDTLVILFSDHGWHLGEKAISGKNSLWERSTRVPLIVAGPGIRSGQRCAQPAELLDIFPTLVDLAGTAPVAGLEGLSLRPQLDHPDTPRRAAVTTHNPDNHAVRDQRWRYIRLGDGSEELYDLSNDPNEWKNLASIAEFRPQIERLKSLLPASSAPHVKGAAGRVLEKSPDGTWLWEGRPIDGDIHAID